MSGQVGKFSPAVLAMLRPTLKPALEELLRSTPAEDIAKTLLPHLKGLVDPGLHHELAVVMLELSRRLIRGLPDNQDVT